MFCHLYSLVVVTVDHVVVVVVVPAFKPILCNQTQCSSSFDVSLHRPRTTVSCQSVVHTDIGSGQSLIANVNIDRWNQPYRDASSLVLTTVCCSLAKMSKCTRQSVFGCDVNNQTNRWGPE